MYFLYYYVYLFYHVKAVWINTYLSYLLKEELLIYIEI